MWLQTARLSAWGLDLGPSCPWWVVRFSQHVFHPKFWAPFQLRRQSPMMQPVELSNEPSLWMSVDVLWDAFAKETWKYEGWIRMGWLIEIDYLTGHSQPSDSWYTCDKRQLGKVYKAEWLEPIWGRHPEDVQPQHLRINFTSDFGCLFSQSKPRCAW